MSGRSLLDLPAGRIYLGRWRTGAGTGEELVVCNRSDWVEIHCHGGTAAARAVIESLVEDGSREVPWAEFAWHLASDDFSAEARIALAQARTERTAAILLDQLRGALREEWRIIESLVASGRSSEAIQRLEQLRSRSQIGLHLTQPFRVVLCGPPNVGKSSLINALLGYQRSVIFHQPGTTRDVLSSHTALDGWPVELSDTAGLREATDPIEAAGVDRARLELQRADLAVIVFDASQPQREMEVQLKSRLPKALAVYNKCDLVRGGTPPSPGLATSALTGEGIETLLTAISQALVPDAPMPGTPLPFTHRQVEMLEQWRAALTQDAAAARVCSFSGDH
ncbi:MAG: 50S ribosome-binding GTPase [Pirellulaceae bacterium]|nr:50S ribosome-binding GTPase [Pirellulaceae bacterium]